MRWWWRFRLKSTDETTRKNCAEKLLNNGAEEEQFEDAVRMLDVVDGPQDQVAAVAEENRPALALRLRVRPVHDRWITRHFGG